MQVASNFLTYLPQPLLDAIVRVRRNNLAFRRWSDGVVDRLRGRDVTVRHGVAKDLILNSGYSNVSYEFALGALEPDSERAFLTLLRPGMTFYDIGANLGWLSLIAARLVGPSGKVVSFEPLDANVRIVEHNLRANGFENAAVLALALGNVDGSAQFLRSSDPSWGMLASTGFEPGDFVAETTVTVRRLDNAVREFHLPPPQTMKIDVEGGEVDVLLGAENTIATFRPLMLVELHGTNTAVADILRRYHYETSLPGSAVAIENAPGNVHVFAIPREHPDRADLLRILQDPAFPQCDRCKEIGTRRVTTNAALSPCGR
jgi:FkbM family methyltransferase